MITACTWVFTDNLSILICKSWPLYPYLVMLLCPENISFPHSQLFFWRFYSVSWDGCGYRLQHSKL